MATRGDDIQIDKGGFVRVHYAIFDLLAKAPLRGQQFRCLMFLFRKTYGYNKKEDKISLAQWADGAGMERHNVWRELQFLIHCNVIYMKKNGPKQANTYGFNKHHEEWNLPSVVTSDYKSVVTDDNNDDESVVMDDYTESEPVVTVDYKSVVTPHERTIDSKDSKEAAAADLPKCNVSDFAQAYQDILGKMVESRIRSEEIQDWETRVPYPAWEYALHEALDKGHRHDWKYTTRILERLEREGYQPKVAAIPLSATVDFALEDLAQ